MQCSIEGCDLPVASRGWCSKHYTRWRRNGDPTVTVRTPPATATATEKICPRCSNTKPIAEFGTRPNGRPKGYCKPCESRYQRGYAETDSGREAHRQARSKWNDGNHGYFLEYRYGITAERYAELLNEQGGRCAICRTDSPGGKARVWCVDHCHNTTEVRGLLCGPCNRGLGQFKDDAARLRAAAEYLDRHSMD